MEFGFDRVAFNNRRRAFEIQILSETYWVPYAHAGIARDERVARVWIANGLRYVLKRGRRRTPLRIGTVQPDDLAAYYAEGQSDRVRRTLQREARLRVEASALSRRELIRRLGIPTGQFYRLIDEGEERISFDRLLSLLEVLGCKVCLTLEPASNAFDPSAMPRRPPPLARPPKVGRSTPGS